MNAAVRAVTRAALARGAEVFGVRNGYAGLLADTMKPLQARDVGGIVQHGGTVLGSARCPEFAEPSGRRAALRNLAARGIDALVVIGGNGSQTGSAALAREGFAFAVETMGRDCGYIALMAGIAGGAEVIVLPESEIAPAEVAKRLRAAYQRGKTHALVVIAEGARCGVKELMQHYAESRDSIGFELRVTRLGHVVRGGAPTAADRILATRLGSAAVETLAQGRYGVLVGASCNEIITTPLADIAGRTRPADAALLELARVMAI